MKPSKNAFLFIAASLCAGGVTHAHIVALGWTSRGGGVVDFSAMHWHGNNEVAGDFIFDGVIYPFTSVTWDTPVLSGFSGALVNSEYATWNPTTKTITAIAGEENWLHVTITGVGRGSHTVSAGPEALTSWTLDGDLSTFDFVLTDGETERLVSSTLRATSIGLARTMTRDVGNRLFRLRSGVRPGTTAPPPQQPSYSKGGQVEPQTMMSPQVCPWEVYGQLYYFSEKQDAQSSVVGNFSGLVHPRTEVDTFGGTVGVDYDIDNNWAAGFAFSLADTEVKQRGIGIKTDIDSLALIPYVSYNREVGPGTFHADLLYAYSDHDYDTRFAGGNESTEGKSNQFELNVGMNYATPVVVHGPFAGLRWLDGEVDRSPISLDTDVDYESLASQLGYQASFPIAMGAGTLVPQVRGAWEHEFESKQGNLAGLPLGELAEDVAVLGAGIGYYVPCGWNVVLDYEARLAGEANSHYVGLKVGMEF